MDLLSVENFLKLTLYLRERLVLFYWIICFPGSALVHVLKSMVYCGSQSEQIIHTTEQNHQPRREENKVQRLMLSLLDLPKPPVLRLLLVAIIFRVV